MNEIINRNRFDLLESQSTNRLKLTNLKAEISRPTKEQIYIYIQITLDDEF